MILLKHLRLNNFLSHEDTNIDFARESKLLIDGVSGSGKSSIVEGIIWALYGKARADNRSIVRRSADDASVTVVLIDASETGERTVEITRSISGKGSQKLKVTVDGKAHELYNLKDLQKWIEEDLIGASYQLFVNSVAYLQGGAESFITQNAARRRELLLEIVKADDFDSIAAKAKDVEEDVSLRIKEIDLELDSITRWKVMANENIQRKPGLQKDLTAVITSIGKLEDEKENASNELAAYSVEIDAANSLREAATAIMKEKDGVYAALQDAKASVDKLKNLRLPGVPENISVSPGPFTVDQIDTMIVSSEEKISKASEIDKKRLEMLNKKPQQKDNSRVIQNIENRIKEIKDADTCPSGDACPHQKDNIELIKRHEKELEVLAKETEDSMSAIFDWEIQYDLLEPIDVSIEIKMLNTLRSLRRETVEYEAEKKILEGRVESIPALEEKFTEVSYRYEQACLKHEAASMNTNEVKYTELKKKVSDLTVQINTERKNEAAIMGDIKYIEKLEGSVEVHNNNETRYTKDREDLVATSSKVALMRSALGSKGLKQVVIDYLIPRLEERINDVLAQMSDFRIHLDTQKPTVSGEGVVEGLFITIINDRGEEMAWENYSGGEKLKITVAISEALASLQKVGFRIFDETFVGLDDNATEDFAGVVGRLQKRFGQVIAISHLTAIKGMFNNSITIKKSYGISRVT